MQLWCVMTHLVAGSSRHQSSMSSSQSPWLTWHWVSPRPTSLHSCSEISASLTCGAGHSDWLLPSVVPGYLAGGVLLAGLLLPGRVPALQLAALGPLHPRLEAGDQVGAGAARGQLQRQGQHIVSVTGNNNNNLPSLQTWIHCPWAGRGSGLGGGC